MQGRGTRIGPKTDYAEFTFMAGAMPATAAAITHESYGDTRPKVTVRRFPRT